MADRNRAGAYLPMLIAGAGMFGGLAVLNYYLQQNLGFSPVRTGLAFLPMVAITMIRGRPSPHLIGLAQLHGYTTAFWWSAAIFASGAIIAGALLRSGPLPGPASHPSPAPPPRRRMPPRSRRHQRRRRRPSKREIQALSLIHI